MNRFGARLEAQVPLDYLRHVIGRYAGVPDVVGEDEYDRSFVMAAGAGVAEDGRGGVAPTLDLRLEGFEERAAAFRAAAPLAARGADEYFDGVLHKPILCRTGLLSRGF